MNMNKIVYILCMVVAHTVHASSHGSGDGDIGCDDTMERTIVILLEGSREVIESDIDMMQEFIVQQVIIYCTNEVSVCGISEPSSVSEFDVSDIEVCVRDSTSVRKRISTYITALEVEITDPDNPMQSLSEESTFVVVSLAAELFESSTNFTVDRISSLITDDDDEYEVHEIAIAIVGIVLCLIVFIIIFGLATLIVVLGIIARIKRRKNKIKPVPVKPADTSKN